MTSGQTELAPTQESALVEVYWLPGCSACLRAKEFIEKAGVTYQAVNLELEPERGEKLEAQSLKVPAICVGDRCVSGHNLGEVAELLGVEYDKREILPTAVLKDRYDEINQTFCRFITQMPDAGIRYSFPNRRRQMLELANHTSLLARAFLAAYYTDVHDISIYTHPEQAATMKEVVAKAKETRKQMADWWEQDGQDDPLDRVLITHVGYRTLHEILEREVWHTTHHVRQLQFVLREVCGIEPDGPITEEQLQGLPLPERLHD